MSILGLPGAGLACLLTFLLSLTHLLSTFVGLCVSLPWMIMLGFNGYVQLFLIRVETTPSTPTSTHNRTRQVWWMTLGSSYMTRIFFFSLNAMLGLVRKYNIYLTTLYFPLSL